MATSNPNDEAKVEMPGNEKSATGSVHSKVMPIPIPPERERNIKERKAGYEYLIVVINFQPGLKFGLGIKNVWKNIFVIKIEENSLVTGLFKEADRVIDVDGDPVADNQKCKFLLVRALKEKKIASLLIERPVSEKAIKEATDEMNEEHNQSVLAPPDVRSIMKKMNAHQIRKSPSMESAESPVAPAQSALTKNNKRADRKAIIVEDGHKSVIIRMDNEENRDKLSKVAPKEPPPPPRRVEPQQRSVSPNPSAESK